MAKLNVSIPDGIDFDRPKTITKEKVFEYISAVFHKYGNFCGDCKHFTENESGFPKCGKGFRPRKYDLELGPYTEVHIRKNCQSWEFAEAVDDFENVKRRVSIALDCAAQQYGGG